MSKKIDLTVTGGAGFIGTAILNLEDRSPIHVLDNLHPQVHPAYAATGMRQSDHFFPFDVQSADQWSAYFRAYRPELILHLAAETGTEQSLFESSRHAGVNVLGTTRMLDALTASGHRPRRIVVASSRAVYGEGLWLDGSGESQIAQPRRAAALELGKWNPTSTDGIHLDVPVPHDATRTPAQPVSIYGITKFAQEQILAAWCAANDVEFISCRLQNVYGQGQSLSNPYTGVLNTFVLQALAGQEISSYEDGGIVRDFVYVTDVARALWAALTGESNGFICDIGSGMGSTLTEVADEIASVLSAPKPRPSAKFRLGDVRAASADITRANALIGFQPMIDLSSGLRLLIDSISKSADGA